MGSTASEPLLLHEADPAAGWVRLTLNRPARRNALNTALMATLLSQLETLQAAPPPLLILDATGPHFCAGADLDWMAGDSDDSDTATAQLEQLLRQLDRFPALTVACTHGTTLGGGVGLLACCDWVLADPGSRITLPELALGLIPALILPYLYRAIGERACRHWCLTGQPIAAPEALQAGLFQQLQPQAGFEEVLMPLKAWASSCSPAALQQCKRWILAQRELSLAQSARDAPRWLAGIRRREDTRERIRAFRNHPGK